MPEQNEKKWKMYKKANITPTSTITKVVADASTGGLLPNMAETAYTQSGSLRYLYESDHGIWYFCKECIDKSSSGGVSGSVPEVLNVFDGDLSTSAKFYVPSATTAETEVGVYVQAPIDTYVMPEYIRVKAGNCTTVSVYGVEEGLKGNYLTKSDLKLLGTVKNYKSESLVEFKINPNPSTTPDKFYSIFYIFCNHIYDKTEKSMPILYHVDFVGTCYIKKNPPTPFTDLVPVLSSSSITVIGASNQYTDDRGLWSVGGNPNPTLSVKAYDGDSESYWTNGDSASGRAYITMTCRNLVIKPSEVRVKLLVSPKDGNTNRTAQLELQGSNVHAREFETICGPLEVPVGEVVELTIPIKTDSYYISFYVNFPASSYARTVNVYDIQITKGTYSVHYW